MFAKLLIVVAVFASDTHAIEHWIQSERVTNWGIWGGVERCWPGTFAQSFMLKTEPNQGIFQDDTANNGIQLNCVDPFSGAASGSIRSGQSPWGNWGSLYSCVPGFASGFTLRSESDQGSGDDTAANNLRVHCTDGKTLEGDGLSFGSWRSPIYCQYTRHAICGITTQNEPNQGSGDDTALNNVDFLCCELPNPAKKCEPAKESTWKVVQQCKSSPVHGMLKDCDLELETGVTYDVSNEDAMRVAYSWEGAGFSLQDAVKDLPETLTASFKSRLAISRTGESNQTVAQIRRNVSVQPGTMSTFSQEVTTCGHYIIKLPKLRREDVTIAGVRTITMIDM